MNINELFDQAVNEVQYLKKGETFVVKDLFKGYEWKRINQGDRSTLGTLFLNFANSDSRIEVIKKNGGLKEYRIKL